MTSPQASTPSPTIPEVRQQIDEWRSSPNKSRRMPKLLWNAAVTLAKTHGVGPVSKKLNIGFADLKRHTFGGPRSSSRRKLAKSGFIKLEPQSPTDLSSAHSTSTHIELSSADGAKMTINVAATSSLDLPSLIGAFRGYCQ